MHSKFPPTVSITSDFKGHHGWWMAQNLIFGHHALLKLVLSILHLLIYHKNLARECQMSSKWITRGPKILLLAPPQPPKLCDSTLSRWWLFAPWSLDIRSPNAQAAACLWFEGTLAWSPSGSMPYMVTKTSHSGECFQERNYKFLKWQLNPRSGPSLCLTCCRRYSLFVYHQRGSLALTLGFQLPANCS